MVSRTASMRTAVLDDKYVFEHDFGLWTFGTVQVLRTRSSGEMVTCKSVQKSSLRSCIGVKANLQRLCELSHDHVSKLKEVIEDHSYYYIISEKSAGNDVADWVVRVQEEGNWLQEQTIADYIRQTLIALAHAHAGRIYHLDLRPSSLALTTKMPDAAIKLCDLGLAQILDPEGEIVRRNSSPFMAPEIANGTISDLGYGMADVWSIGAVTHLLLVGSPPSHTVTSWGAVVFKNDNEAWVDRSPLCRDFVQRLLVAADKRPTASRVLQHPWLRSIVRLDAARLSMGDSVARELQRGLLAYMLSTLLLPEAVEFNDFHKLRLAFQKADTDNDGLVARPFVHRILRERGASSEVSVAALDAADVCKTGVLDLLAAAAADFIAVEVLMKEQNPTRAAANLVPALMKLVFRCFGRDETVTVSSIRSKLGTATAHELEACTSVNYDEIIACMPQGEMDYQKLLSALSCSAGAGTPLYPSDDIEDSDGSEKAWGDGVGVHRIGALVSTLFQSCGVGDQTRGFRRLLQA